MMGSASKDAFKDLQYQRLNNPKKKKLRADTVICIPLYSCPLVILTKDARL